MSSLLLHADEETDPGAFGAYLRAQSDADLLDVARHLDPDRYPARSDAAGREIRRRGLWEIPAFSAGEMAIRRLALLALALAAVLLLLAWGLTPEDAAAPPWPTGEQTPDGTPLGEVVRQFSVAIGRAIVVWSARFGVFSLLLAGLGGCAGARARATLRGRARADVWRLTSLGFALLLLAVGAATGPQSAVPSLFGVPKDAAPWDRALPLWDPFASYSSPP